MKTIPVSKLAFGVLFPTLFLGLSNLAHLSLASGPIAHAAIEPAACPDTTLGEKPEDCPWAGVARTLIAEADAGHPVAPAMEAMVPKLVAQIKTDAENTELKELWGQSINFDENAKGIIIQPAIINTLAEMFKVPAPNGRVVHAGMEHTYGYLFSILNTPFGYKRARWVQGEIEEGFNLPKGALGPDPEGGTLLTNITAFIGAIAFRTEPAEMESLEKHTRGALKDIRRFDFGKLKPSRLEERVEVPNDNGKVRTVKIYTDIVPFLTVKNPAGNTHLLIYTIVDPFHHNAQLISAFPVASSFGNRVLDAKQLGKHQSVTTRYNGYVEGLSGTSLFGERSVKIHPVKTPKWEADDNG